MIKRYFILIACIALLLFSCKDPISEGPPPDPGLDNGQTNNEYVNEWIYDGMSLFYLWNASIPNRPNYELNPEDFFESLLYAGDRFSWIQEDFLELLDMLSGVTPYDIGFEHIPYSYNGEIFGQIAYVKPNTDAEKIGLKRGDYFIKVNGIMLNATNYWSLLSGSETSVTITFVDGNTGEITDKTVKKEASYAEDPVFFDKVYEVSGHKIGYLVYNFFASGPTDGSFIYDKKLNDAFGGFKSAGITELVLDLRYNSGGSMNSATLLGSMIVPDLNTDNIFTKIEYNPLLQWIWIREYGEDSLLDRLRDKLETGEAINNVGNTIQSLYVLTTSWTASASELIINNLKPYMPVVIIGDVTVGKNVGSVLLYEDDDPQNKWGMLPVALYYFNKDGSADFSDGFVPDIFEYDNSDKLPLGDLNECMLKIAVDHITGTYVPSSVRSVVSGRITAGSSIERKAWAGKTIVDNPLLKKLPIR